MCANSQMRRPASDARVTGSLSVRFALRRTPALGRQLPFDRAAASDSNQPYADIPTSSDRSAAIAAGGANNEGVRMERHSRRSSQRRIHTSTLKVRAVWRWHAGRRARLTAVLCLMRVILWPACKTNWPLRLTYIFSFQSNEQDADLRHVLN